MVQIFIRNNYNSSNDNELILIELQGSFESNQPSLNNLTVGELDLGDESRPKIRVGNQQLIGTRTKLKEPLALIVNQNNQEGDLSYQNTNNNNSNLTYNLKSIIKEKLLFEVRPGLLINKD